MYLRMAGTVEQPARASLAETLAVVDAVAAVVRVRVANAVAVVASAVEYYPKLGKQMDPTHLMSTPHCSLCPAASGQETLAQGH